MSIKVPYLADADIEKRASALLAKYSLARNIQVRAPIPLDDILVHLGLRLDLDDLRTTLGIPDVLGALWIEEKRIYIDQSLDPDERPSALGRFNFTLGHEIGHWCLHRPYVEIQQLQGDLLQTSSCPSIVCRTSQQRERIELQADAFSGALLMPRSEVITHWHRLIGPERLKLGQWRDRAKRDPEVTWLRRGPGGPRSPMQENELVELTIRPMAAAFEVSLPAMRIRLEQLGLIVRDLNEALVAPLEAT
jgi:Zn-dependent peptidase ImmA (M78 family)